MSKTQSKALFVVDKDSLEAQNDDSALFKKGQIVIVRDDAKSILNKYRGKSAKILHFEMNR